MTGSDLEQVEISGASLRSLLRPAMTAVAVGSDTSAEARLMAELVGPAGRVLEIDPATKRLAEALPAEVDLILFRAGASEHRALGRVRGLIERRCPLLLVEFWPQRLREQGVDPVSALDSYRAIGLRAIGAERSLPTDPSHLVLAVDAAVPPHTMLRLQAVEPPAPAAERLLPAHRYLGRRWARLFPPVEPRTLEYDAAHRALVRSLLESEKWIALFERERQLPPGLGAGFDERIVEYPWLFSRSLSGRVLDAGSVLNHRHVLESMLPEIDELTILTLAPEPVAFTELGVSYLYGDLRALPLRDDWFDEIVCLSTLEHVGMDTSVYGAGDAPAEDPRAEAAQALRELLRVVRPGGRIHLSLPFGRREDHGWLRQLDRADVDDLLTRAGVDRHEETIFLRSARGWRRGKSRAAVGTGYHPGPGRAADGAVAARAVLCTTIFV